MGKFNGLPKNINKFGIDRIPISNKIVSIENNLKVTWTNLA
jgi:hypothetical protein